MSVSCRVSFDSKAHEEKLLESLIDTFKKKCMREVSGSVESVGDGRFFARRNPPCHLEEIIMDTFGSWKV